MPLNNSTSMKLFRKSLIEKADPALTGVSVTADMTTSLLPDIPRRLHPGADHDQPDQRDRNEDLPAQTHDLVVAKARERGPEPDEHRDHDEGLQPEPNPARDRKSTRLNSSH